MGQDTLCTIHTGKFSLVLKKNIQKPWKLPPGVGPPSLPLLPGKGEPAQRPPAPGCPPMEAAAALAAIILASS